MRPGLTSRALILALACTPGLGLAAAPAPKATPAPSASVPQSQLRKILFIPAPAVAPGPTMPAFQHVSIPSTDGVVLDCWWRTPATGKPVFMFFPGNGNGPSHHEPTLSRFARQGAGFLAVAYRGYEGSTGSPTEAGLHDDARAAYDWLAGKVVANRIVIVGYSMGTGVAVKLATEKPGRAVVLLGPMTSIDEVFQQRYPTLHITAMEDGFRSRDWIGALRMPLLIMHGDKDQTIPFSMGRQLFALAPQPKTFVRVEGADHADLVEAGALDAVWALLGIKLARTTADPGRQARLDITPPAH